MAVGYRCADIYLRFPEIAEDEFNELMEFIGDDSIVCRGATKYVRELEKQNEELKKQNEYYKLLNKNKMYRLECSLREILKYCNHLHNDCKYNLNDGHIRKIRNICKRELKSEEQDEENRGN